MHINDFPPEILRYVFSHLSPYNDLISCRLVCKYWCESVAATLEAQAIKFRSSLRTADVQWYYYLPEEAPSISARYSHSCCLHSNLMYIFGGCTNDKTTFNDLWTFNLSKRQWIRPIASGNYPPPKAFSSIVPYRNHLVVFGGWTYSSRNRMNNSAKIFNHIHFYNTLNKKWVLVETRNKCPGMSGHGACVYNDQMIIFGGLRANDDSPYHPSPCDEVWVLDFISLTWRMQRTSEIKPEPRYGHTQLIIENHLIVIGGCGGPNNILNDIWCLNLDGQEWKWMNVSIDKNGHDFPILGLNPTCKVDQMLVLLSRLPGTKTSPTLSNSSMIRMITQRKLDELQTVPEKSSSSSTSERLFPLEKRQALCSECRSSDISHCPRPNVACLRRRRESAPPSSEFASRPNSLGSKMSFRKAIFQSHPTEPLILFTIDISQMISHKKVTLIPQTHHVPGPQELTMYSLVVGNSELIMFGGYLRDNGSNTSSLESNSVFIVTSKKSFI